MNARHERIPASGSYLGYMNRALADFNRKAYQKAAITYLEAFSRAVNTTQDERICALACAVIAWSHARNHQQVLMTSYMLVSEINITRQVPRKLRATIDAVRKDIAIASHNCIEPNDPNMAVVKCILGNLCASTLDYIEAQRQYLSAEQIFDAYASAHIWRGYVRHRLGMLPNYSRAVRSGTISLRELEPSKRSRAVRSNQLPPCPSF